MAEIILRFRTAAELKQETPSETQWIAKPWVAVGAVTALDGKPKAGGKTTWVLNMTRCVLDGSEFMGEPTIQSPVVYLSEENTATFCEALDRARLLDSSDLHLLFCTDARTVSWPKIIKGAVRKCHDVQAKLLVVDTFAPFAKLTGDKENSSGHVLEAFGPLHLAASLGLAVLVVRHERKSGGDVGDSARGSNAFTGAADTVISIGRAESNPKGTIRQLRTLSRFSGPPDTLYIELTDDGFVRVGDSAAVAVGEAVEKILNLAPVEESEALTLDEIVIKGGIRRTTAQKALDKLLADGRLKQCGKGVKGSPKRFWAPIHSATTPIPKEAEGINQGVSLDTQPQPKVPNDPQAG